jgi:hypothetical protein
VDEAASTSFLKIGAAALINCNKDKTTTAGEAGTDGFKKERGTGRASISLHLLKHRTKIRFCNLIIVQQFWRRFITAFSNFYVVQLPG